jgi:hypothetical protein
VQNVPNTIRSVSASLNAAGRLQVRASSTYAAKALLQAEITYYNYSLQRYVTGTWPMTWASNRWNLQMAGFVSGYGMPVRARIFGPEGSFGPANISGARPPVPLAANP